MSMTRFQRYSAAIKTQYRLMLLPSILPSLLFALLSPAVFSIQNLDAYNASVVMERFFALVGIFLLTPIPLPEQDENIRDVVASRYTSFVGILFLRFCLLLPFLLLLVGGLCTAMFLNGSAFPFVPWLFGGVVSAFFLGVLGFFTFCATSNWVAGYLAPACFFTLNMSAGPKMGRFYLFSLGSASFIEKYWLLSFGLLLLLATFVLLEVKK